MQATYLFLISLFLVFSKLEAQVFHYQETCSESMEFPFEIGGFDVKQDSVGVLYFATVEGVTAFDGVSTRLFRLDHRRYAEPPPQYATSLLITKDQRIWAGMRNGLAWLNKRSGFLEEIISVKGKSMDIAFDLFEDREGFIWVDTYDGYAENGVATRFHPVSNRKITYYLFDETGRLFPYRIEALFHDELGFRFLTANKSYQIIPQNDSNGVAVPLKWPGGSANAHFRTLLAKDKAGQYWALDNLGRLHRGPKLEQMARFEAIPEVAEWQNVKVSLDRQGRVWLYDVHLAVFDPMLGKGQHIGIKPCNFANECIRFLFHDQRNIHWIGPGRRQTGGTVHLLTELPLRFGIWEPEPKPAHIFHIYREPNHDDLWVGTYSNGAYQLNSKFEIKRRWTIDDGLLTNRIIFLAPAGTDEVWFNSVPKGIVRYHKKKNKLDTLKSPDRKPYQECFLLKDQRLLLAAYNETCIYDPRTGLFQPNPPLPVHGFREPVFRFVQDIEDDGDDIWMGGYDKRIHRLNLKTNQLTTIDTSFIRHNVMCLKRRGDSLFVGTLGQGLAIYDIQKQCFVANYMTPQGFPHHTIYGIETDRKQRLWIFSSTGLTLFEPEKQRFTEFGVIDGIPWEGFHSGAVYQDDRGYIYAGADGMLWFHPDSLVRSRPNYEVNITITDLLLGGKSRLPEPGKVLYLNPDENYFEIQFSNLDFGFPRADTFWYKLEGLDPSWHLTTKNSITFNRIPPGNYVFKLRGTNRFGVISPLEDRISINISAWWWQKRWVHITLAISLVLLGFYFWNGYADRKNAREDALRIQMQLKSLEALRGRLNHHFVKNTIGRSNAKLLSENVEEANHYLGQLAKLMELVLVGAKDDFYTLGDESAIMRLYLDIQCKRWRGIFSTRYEISPELEASDYYVPSMIIQPLAENAIEHGLLPKSAGERHLTISWEFTNEMLHCTILDTGEGMKSKNNHSVSTKIGLENIRDRLNTIESLYRVHVSMEIHSPPKGGVMVCLKFPMLKSPPML